MPKNKIVKQKVTFTYIAPDARSVAVVGGFTRWQDAPVALKKDKSGIWKKTVTLSPGKYEYRFLVDGEWRDDPQCAERSPNEFGGENCVCTINDNIPLM